MKSGICLLAFFAICVATPAAETATFDRTLPVAGRVLLDVRGDSGGIDIKAIDGISAVRVHAVIKPLYGKLDLGLAEANIRELQRNPPIEQSGASIRVGYAQPDLLRRVSIHFDLEVPRESAVHAQTTSGGIKIDGVAGPANTETTSGRTEISGVAGEVIVSGHSGAIVLRNIGGHVSARSRSGGIQILSAHGPVEVETTSGRTEVSDVLGEIRSTTRSGSIRIDNAKGAVVATNNSGSIDASEIAGAVQAHTRSGSIRISQISPAPIRAQTHSGAINVELARGRGYRIDAQSDSGRISVPRYGSFDAVANIHRFQRQLGTGGPLVDLDTHSSKIEIN